MISSNKCGCFLFRDYYFNIISDKKSAFNNARDCFQLFFQRSVNIMETGIKDIHSSSLSNYSFSNKNRYRDPDFPAYRHYDL